MPEPLDYDRDGAAHESRSRMLRQLWVVIGLKVVLVIANTIMAFSTVPIAIKVIGAAFQVALTLVFLGLILRLTTRR